MFRTKNFYTKNTFTIGIILLFILLIFRAISIYFKLPRPIYYSNLFNSNAFALSEINPSLGDFLINSFLLLLLVLFIYFRLKKVELEKYNMFIVNILLIILSLFSLALFINSILSIYVGSQYLFDLKLNFSLSDWTFKIAVILVFIINASIYLFIQNLVVSGFRKIDLSKTMLATFILSIIFLSSLLIYFFEFSILFLLLNLAYCFIIFRLNYQLSINKYSYKLLVYLGVTALFCSIYSTIIDYKQSLNSEFLKKQQFGKSKLEDNDKMGEFLIEIADESIKNSDPIKKNLGERAINFDLIDKEVKNVHLKNWFDKYEIKIYYYDVNGKNLKNRFADSYEIKWNNYLTKGENTIIDNLIFIPGDQYSNTKKYLNRIRLTTNNNSQITLLILLEGIKKNSEIDKFMGVNPGKNLKYNFYVFSNIDTDDVGSLNNDYQKGNVKNLLLNPEIYNKVLTINGINYAAFRNPAGESVLVFSSEKLFSEIFIDFLFLFTILLIVFILGLLLVAIFRNTKIFEQSYSSKIQAYFGLIFFVPFLISIVLIFQVINKSSKEKEKINTEALVNKITNEFLKLTEIAPLNIKNKYFWEDEIVDLKAKFNSDLHIYNLDGIFLSGSGFIKKSLSKNTISAIDLASKNANNLLFEKDGSIYKYILNKNGRKLGIFAIPNFLFASSESNEIHNLLRSIFSTFALLFLLF